LFSDPANFDPANLEYDLVSAVVPSFPANGEIEVPTSALTISWEQVASAKSIVIDIENLITGTSLEVDLPGDATSFTVPDGVLKAGTEYQVGFEAVHQNGNANVTEDYSFTTAGTFVGGDNVQAEDSFGDFESLAFHVVYNSTDNDAQFMIEAEAIDEITITELTITHSSDEVVHEVEFKDAQALFEIYYASELKWFD